MSERILKIDNAVKQYRLGQINGGTLTGDLQSLWARIRKKEDPNTKVGTTTTKGIFNALNGVSFEVNAGERVGIIGHNGAGKSTLLKLISRVTAPTKGSIWLNGRVASMLEVGTGFHPELTGRENVYLNGAILGMTKDEVTKKFDEIVRFAEMERFIDTPVKRYSSGMYVKLAFSVAAHLDSEIVIMDEVLAVGDMKFQQKCIQKMNQLSLEEGRTILYVSHNMNTIRQLCSRCIVLNQGQVQYNGDVETAISIYMNKNGDAIIPKHELDNAARSPYSPGKRIRALSFEFLETQTCSFDWDKPVKIKFKWKANEDTENVRVRFEIHTSDRTPVAMAETDILGNGKAGCVYENECEFDISCLAEGSYFLRLDVYSTTELGAHTSYDYVEKDIFFLVENNQPNKIVWLSRVWGHTRLHNVKVLGCKEYKED